MRVIIPRKVHIEIHHILGVYIIKISVFVKFHYLCGIIYK